MAYQERVKEIRSKCPEKLFPDPRRIVTTHTSSGEATVLSDTKIHCPITPLGANMVELWQTGLPSDNLAEGDPVAVSMFATGKGLSRPDGVVLRVVDLPPNMEKSDNFFHRTISTDFIILIEGSCTCVLDNGEEVFMDKAGDVLVQRGTIHGWYNASEKPARFYAVLIGAKKIEIDGKELGKQPTGV